MGNVYGGSIAYWLYKARETFALSEIYEGYQLETRGWLPMQLRFGRNGALINRAILLRNWGQEKGHHHPSLSAVQCMKN
jgi:hypothetical protein